MPSEKKVVARFTLALPDGSHISLPLFEGESLKEKAHTQLEHWYKVTKEDLKTFGHFHIKDKCPNCGGEMMAKLINNGCAIWCTNYPKCSYHDFETGGKVRARIYEKHSLKTTYVYKTGCGVIFSNKQIKNEKNKTK